MNVTYNAKTEHVEWAPYRGDYGADHSSDLIEAVEDLNCSKGCTRSGSKAAREEFGPGGNCHVLAALAMAEYGGVVPELEPAPSGPHCRARIELPPKPEPRPRRHPAPAGIPPLFPLED